MPKSATPSYISALLKPMPCKGTDRRAWSIPLQGVWIPFFTATNTAGETAIAAEALGAPLRLQRNPDGTPKFGNTGRPVIRVVKAKRKPAKTETKETEREAMPVAA